MLSFCYQHNDQTSVNPRFYQVFRILYIIPTLLLWRSKNLVIMRFLVISKINVGKNVVQKYFHTPFVLYHIKTNYTRPLKYYLLNYFWCSRPIVRQHIFLVWRCLLRLLKKSLLARTLYKNTLDRFPPERVRGKPYRSLNRYNT